MVVHPCNPSIWDTRQEEQEFRVVHSYLKVLGSPGIHKTRFKFFLKTERRRRGDYKDLWKGSQGVESEESEGDRPFVLPKP